MFGSMFETASYHRGLQWPSAPSACGYTMPTFDTASSSRLSSSVPRGHVPASTSGYSALGDHDRYGGAPEPLYDGRAAVREVLFGCGRASALQTAGVNEESRQPSSAAAFSPLSLSCVGPSEAPTSTGTVADCPAPPRLPTAPYGYSATDAGYYSNGTGIGGTTAAFGRDVQSAGCGQPTTGFRSPALSLGFNPRRLMNDVIGEYFNFVFSAFKNYKILLVQSVLKRRTFLATMWCPVYLEQRITYRLYYGFFAFFNNFRITLHSKL